jgi:hypothetical protein
LRWGKKNQLPEVANLAKRTHTNNSLKEGDNKSGKKGWVIDQEEKKT